jgi:hypothetical protein
MRGMGMTLAAALVAAACGGGRATEPMQGDAAHQVVESGGTVRLKVGETARLAGTNVLVTLRGVADSRCPIDALCVWPGDAEVRLDVAGPGPSAQSVVLRTFTEPKVVHAGGSLVRLLTVAPAPVSSRPTQESEFVVTLEVRR